MAPQYDEEDAFWYQSDVPPAQQQKSTNVGNSDNGFDTYTNNNQASRVN